MYTLGSIILMIFFVIVAAGISFAALTATASVRKVSGTKVMLLGLGLIAFSNAVLKGMVQGDIDVTISIIGLGILLSGLIFKETNT